MSRRSSPTPLPPGPPSALWASGAELPSHSAVARLQQASGLWTLGWTWGLALWGWQSDAFSAAWALLPLGCWVAVLVFQFGCAYAVNARRGLAAWRWVGLFQALTGELVAATAVFGWRQPWGWRTHPPAPLPLSGALAPSPPMPAPAQPAQQQPLSAPGSALAEPVVRAASPRGVLLVHGYLCNRGLWARWQTPLAQRGHAVEAVNLEPVWGSIDAYVPTLEAAVARLVARTGQPPLVVAHSMGGLAVRAWMRAASGNERRVAHVVTIGTPHQGTWLARWGHGTNVRQMRVGSPWLQTLAAAEPALRAAQFTCWHSQGDNIVFPYGTAVLPGSEARALAHVGHVALVDDPRVLAHTLQWLAAHAENPAAQPPAAD